MQYYIEMIKNSILNRLYFNYFFDPVSFLKRGTLLLIAICMSASACKLFLDFFLIDKKVLNPDLHE